MLVLRHTAFAVAVLVCALLTWESPMQGHHEVLSSKQPSRQPTCTVAASFYTMNTMLLGSAGHNPNSDISTLTSAVPGTLGLSPSRPAWLADGKALIVRSGRGSMTELFFASLSTREVRLVADNAHRFDAPALAPDGRTLVYGTDFLGVTTRRSNELVLLDLATGAQTLYAPLDGYYGNPRWSPDGTQIVFSFDGRGGREALYLMSADGTALTALLHERSRAAWSPDGQSLALTLRREGQPRLWHYTLADGALRPLGDSNLIFPAWSPDGTRIVAVHTLGVSRSHLVMVDVATGTVTDLTEGRGDVQDTYPQWSPEGRQIAFISNRVRAIYNDVWLINADGTNAYPLTSESGATGPIAWNPVTCANE